MSQAHAATQDAIDRMVAALGTQAPSILDQFNAPVSDHDLIELRRAIAPYDLPADLETFLRFADGMRWGDFRLPHLIARLLPAAEMLEWYRSGLLFQPSGLLPICYESHYQVSIELTADGRPPALIETTVSSVEWIVYAPSIAGMLDALSDMATTGALHDWPIDNPIPDAEHWAAEKEAFFVRENEFEERINRSFATLDWSTAPFERGEFFEPHTLDDDPWGPFPQQ